MHGCYQLTASYVLKPCFCALVRHNYDLLIPEYTNFAKQVIRRIETMIWL